MLAKYNRPIFLTFVTKINPMEVALKKKGRKKRRYDKTNFHAFEKSKNNLNESNRNISVCETLTESAISNPVSSINTGSNKSICFNNIFLNKEMKVPAAPKPKSATEIII